MSATVAKVCVIGAGPNGMSVLFQFDQLDNPSVEVICYEKGSDWGGLWNFTWMTGTDEFGEPCHCSQYKYLWSNGPKEELEYPDYTFEEHYGKPTPSFAPRSVLRDYLEGRFTKKSKTCLKRFIKFNTVVRHVRYNKTADNFIVTTEDLQARRTYENTFTHVIAASGIFSFPNKPIFPGIETFIGRIVHSHDFRDAHEFRDQRILLIGSSYSADDIAMQCMKFGAKSVVTSYRTRPMNFKFPAGIEERPLVTKIGKNTIYFKDGSTAYADAIILCTGYLYHFPYFCDELRLYSSPSNYPTDLYKGALWLKGGNNNLFYLGVQDSYFTFTMFDVHALWVCKYITGTLPNEPKSMDEMRKDEQHWIERNKAAKDAHDNIDFQAALIADLCEATGYNKDILKGGEMLHKVERDRDKNIVTYRDQQFQSIYTGMEGSNHKPWYENFDDSIEAFLS